ncbi:MAG: hypothetical protein MZV63_36750 [Marinilabiliales bacterium]|nr:hypothetical protein [Marinilabiliales bacterium]
MVSWIGHWNSGNTDMQDNVVTALYANPDVNSELWIITAGTVTKAYVNLPFTQFSEKSGLDGSINSFINLTALRSLPLIRDSSRVQQTRTGQEYLSFLTRILHPRYFHYLWLLSP